MQFWLFIPPDNLPRRKAIRRAAINIAFATLACFCIFYAAAAGLRLGIGL